MIAVVGISGCGKTYLISKAVEIYSNMGLITIPAVTTRKPREGEEQTGSRIFVSEKDFEKMRDAGELALVNYVYGAMYAYKKDMISVDKVFIEAHQREVKELMSIDRNVDIIFVRVKDAETAYMRTHDRKRTAEEDRFFEMKEEQKDIEEWSLHFDGKIWTVDNGYDIESEKKFLDIVGNILRIQDLT